jgi:hypothetical protein
VKQRAVDLDGRDRRDARRLKIKKYGEMKKEED